MISFRTVIGAALALGLATAGAAQADVTASASGWITEGGNADNSFGSNSIDNNFTGFEGQRFNNWFEFTLGNGAFDTAALNIWNDGANSSVDPNAVYSLHGATGETFAGLQAGPSLGSITLGEADTGISHFVSILFNADGLNFLNSHLGQTIQIGGTLDTVVDPTNCFDCVAAFGYTGGAPAAFISGAAGAPEPATWALMIGGFGLAGAALRRRKWVVAA